MSEKQRYTGSPSLSVKKSRRREESVHALSPSLSLFLSLFPKSVRESRPKTRPRHLYRAESRRTAARKKLSGKGATTFRAPLAISQLRGYARSVSRSSHDRPKSLCKRLRRFSLPNRLIRGDSCAPTVRTLRDAVRFAR